MATPARNRRVQAHQGHGGDGSASEDGGRQAEVFGRPEKAVRDRATEGGGRDEEEAVVRQLR